ncbi:MAG: RNA polymerase sigma factor SigJ [Microthrixaceae bacterium]|nr:RNA polymerase sigma factor SigJ [Microthrixaceae bacterium]
MSDLSAVERFEPHRGRLFAVAYRMTGSVVDAEDCIQEAFVRWQRVDLDTVQNDEAYLVRVTSRLAIDRQRQAARRRETYVGPWLPEPLLAPLGTAPASPLSSPEHEVELADSLSFAFLVLLDRLSPAERAAFILHDVFGVPFDEVAQTLDRDTDACRQLASRGRRKLHDVSDSEGLQLHGRARYDLSSSAMAALLGSLLSGDVEGCLAHLAPDVVLVSDGGPKRRAARRHVVGADRVLRLVINLFNRDVERVSSIAPVSVNGSTGLYVEHEDGPMVFTGDVGDDGRLRRVWILMNPDKIARPEHL